MAQELFCRTYETRSIGQQIHKDEFECRLIPGVALTTGTMFKSYLSL